MTRLEYLNKQRDMAYHNLMFCSGNASMTRAKVGHEEGFKEAKEVCGIVEELIAETRGIKKVTGAMVIDGEIIHNWEKVLEAAGQVAAL